MIGPTRRAVIRVVGADRAAYLDAVLSQAIAALEPDDVRGALYLDIHGNPLAEFLVVVRDDDVLLVSPDREAADAVASTLGGRTFLSDAQFEVADLGVDALRGDLSDLADVVPSEGRAVTENGTVVARTPWGVEVIGDDAGRAAFASAVADLGVTRVPDTVVDDARIRSGEPVWGREIAAPHLPEELGLLPTHVHLAKGCYPGQEAVARMWMLGRPRRRLAMVQVDGDVQPGWTVGEGRDRVVVTSVTREPLDGSSPSDGSATGMAFVPSATEVGTTRAGAGGLLRVVGFVGDGLPVPGHDPGVRRRRDRAAGGTPDHVD